MNVAAIFFWVLGGLAVAYQLLVSVLVARSPVFSGRQKIAQIVLIWFLPMLGAFIAHWTIRSTHETVPVSDRSFIREDNTHW